MKLSPLDIRRQEFKRVVRGVDAEEVSVFLDMVAGEYERILRDNKTLGEERDELKRKVDELDGMRDAIQGAVVMAKKSADDAISQAKKEAELRLKEAEVESERMLEDARRQASLLKREMDDIRNQRSVLVSRLESLLDGQMKMLDAYVADWGQDERPLGQAERRMEEAERRMEEAERRMEETGRRMEETGRDLNRRPGAKGKEQGEDFPRRTWIPESTAPSAQPEFSRSAEQAASVQHEYGEPVRAAEESGWAGVLRPGPAHVARTPDAARFLRPQRAVLDPDAPGGRRADRPLAEDTGGREASEKQGPAPEPRIRELTPRQMK